MIMEPSFELISKYRYELETLPFLKEGFSRLLYPIDQENKVTDGKDSKNDCDEEIEKSICEFVFFYNAILTPLVGIINPVISHVTASFLLHLNKYFRNGHHYASFDDVHYFLIHQNIKELTDILQAFGFSTKSIIELCELQREYYESRLQFAKNKDKSLAEEEEEEEDIAPYLKESRLKFIDLIRHEDYPSLFHAVYVYNHLIPNLDIDYDFFRPLFIKKKEYNLNEWPQNYSYAAALFCFEAEKIAAEDFEHVFYDLQYFSECKFTKWVDEWDTQIDSFIKEHLDRNPNLDLKDRYLLRDRQLEQVKDYFKQVLITRGWKVPNFKSGYIIDNPTKIMQLKWITGVYLFGISQVYSIVRDVLYEGDRTVINWLLERTHYNTIFNKLVEYFTTKYLDKGQEQTTLQESGSSAIETSNETEQQNSPVIVIDKDETHKKWFVRVHEKKINAQPDEWNKKLYACLDALYDSLVKKGLMCESSKKELFIYRFSGFNIPEPFNPQEKIRWEGENVLLGYLVRCLITYTGTRAKGLGTVATFFESKRGKNVNLATADYISKEKFNQTPNMYTNLSLAVEILKECGFDEVEATSTRIRDK